MPPEDEPPHARESPDDHRLQQPSVAPATERPDGGEDRTEDTSERGRRDVQRRGRCNFAASAGWTYTDKKGYMAPSSRAAAAFDVAEGLQEQGGRPEVGGVPGLGRVQDIYDNGNPVTSLNETNKQIDLVLGQ